MSNIVLTIKGAIAVFGGILVHYLGGLDALLTLLILVVVLDYISGVINAIISHKLSSEVGFKGIGKKVLSFIIVALAYGVQTAIAIDIPLREIVIMFYVANEGISIVENSVRAGLPVPEKLKDVLVQLKGRKQ